jgi:hypothetical protein
MAKKKKAAAIASGKRQEQDGIEIVSPSPQTGKVLSPVRRHEQR